MWLLYEPCCSAQHVVGVAPELNKLTEIYCILCIMFDMLYFNCLICITVPCLQVSLVGHSAGAQMCAMALLHRAQGLRKHKQSQHSTHNPRQSSELGGQSDLVLAELRMPARFIGTPSTVTDSLIILLSHCCCAA